jgi:hypothetical protein
MKWPYTVASNFRYLTDKGFTVLPDTPSQMQWASIIYFAVTFMEVTLTAASMLARSPLQSLA